MVHRTIAHETIGPTVAVLVESFRTGRYHQQQPRRRCSRRKHHGGEGIKGKRVGPMGIFEHDDERTFKQRRFDRGDHRSQEISALSRVVVVAVTRADAAPEERGPGQKGYPKPGGEGPPHDSGPLRPGRVGQASYQRGFTDAGRTFDQHR